MKRLGYISMYLSIFKRERGGETDKLTDREIDKYEQR